MEKEKFAHIEERLTAIEGGRDYAFADMAELCLVPNVVIPPKFKVPDFNKYKGTTCPKNHLKMYSRKIGAYSKNEKLLMHFFQVSQPTLQREGDTRLTCASSNEGKHADSPPMLI